MGSLLGGMMLSGLAAWGYAVGIKYRLTFPTSAAWHRGLRTSVAVLIIAVVFGNTLNMYGPPIRTWQIFGACAIFSALFIDAEPKARLVSRCCLVAAVGFGLCFLSIVGGDYTGVGAGPNVIQDAVNQRILRECREQVRNSWDRETGPQTGFVTFEGGTLLSGANEIDVRSEWHTRLTGIYRVRKSPLGIWVSPDQDGSPSVEFRRLEAR